MQLFLFGGAAPTQDKGVRSKGSHFSFGRINTAIKISPGTVESFPFDRPKSVLFQTVRETVYLSESFVNRTSPPRSKRLIPQ